MAVTLCTPTSYEENTGPQGAANGDWPITVPTDCDCAVVLIGGWDGQGALLALTQLSWSDASENVFTVAKNSSSADQVFQSAAWYMLSPPTGSQTLSWAQTWGGSATAPSQGGTMVIVYLKGVVTSSALGDTDTSSALGGVFTASLPNITSGDMAITYGWDYNDGAGQDFEADYGTTANLLYEVDGANDGDFGIGYEDGESGPQTNAVQGYDTSIAFVLKQAAAGVTYTLTASKGSHAQTGKVANLLKGSLLTAAQGTYLAGGKTANLLKGYLLPAEIGSYLFGGKTANLLRGFRLSAEKGAYTKGGTSTGLSKDFILTAGKGSYTLSGQVANLVYTPLGGYVIASGPGSYALSGHNADLIYTPIAADYSILCETGSYSIYYEEAELMGRSTPFRKMGAHAMEDRRGQKTLIAYDESGDTIVHLGVDSDGNLKVNSVEQYWNRTRYEWDIDGNLLYKGRHTNFDARVSDINHDIIKYTYSSGDLVDKQQTTGAWESRDSINW